ncbi:hypothetical protein [Cupriavidus sp. SW-Y-13]|uniref:hypothetical protein n=1 Tax=Cupriavidus sp. SW-Y-13 TaxID=2653854 RepID=UPI001365ED84|nr:hypothetical protein [Cupriavidus sp. SW-Y-13]MWL91373.1 hypothetical protein [Cupriavidus sp. SW-Y-13]
MTLMVVLKVADSAIPGGGTTVDAAARLLRVLADDLVQHMPNLEDGASVRTALADGLILGVATYVADDPVAMSTSAVGLSTSAPGPLMETNDCRDNCGVGA